MSLLEWATKLLQASANVAEIVAAYRGDADHIRADVAKTIAEMKQSGLLVAS